MSGTIQKKSALVKELSSQEVMLANALHENAILRKKLSTRRAILWFVFIALIAFIAFTTGGVVATW
jgi:hypothetical protein